MLQQTLVLTGSVDHELLKSYGVVLRGEMGERSTLSVGPPGNVARNLQIELFGKPDVFIDLKPGSAPHGGLRVEGASQKFIIEGCTNRPFVLRAIMRGLRGQIKIGHDSTSNGTELLLDGTDTEIEIGNDCMFSNNFSINASDSHAIFDLSTLDTINAPASVVIGDHVWLGHSATVMKGATIGRGSIIGHRAIVTEDIPERALAVGSPARAIRQNVSWTRRVQPTTEDMLQVCQRLGLAGT